MRWLDRRLSRAIRAAHQDWCEARMAARALWGTPTQRQAEDYVRRTRRRLDRLELTYLMLVRRPTDMEK